MLHLLNYNRGCLAFDPSAAWQRQQATIPGVISGRVLDESGNAINGASIYVKGSNIASASDVNGFFKLQNVPVNGSIVISSVGYTSKEIKAKPGYINITLAINTKALEEVVVVGYGADKDQTVRRQMRVTENALEGRVADIEIVSVATQYQPTTTVYKIDEKYTLETDGKTTTIGIKRLDIPALYEYFSTPKVDPSAFLTAKVINWQGVRSAIRRN